jgi:hypothetical protein
MKHFFISYGAEDVPLVRFLHRYLNDLFQGAAKFFQADLIPPSSDWEDHLRKQITRSDGALFVLTPRSIFRPWLHIELGAIWWQEKPISPLIVGGLNMSKLPQPLSTFQAVSLEKPESVAALIRKISEICGLKTPPTYDAVEFCHGIADASGGRAFENIHTALEKLVRTECPEAALLNRGAVTVEPAQMSWDILRGNTLQLTGKVSDTATACLTFRAEKPVDFLILEAQHTERFDSNFFDQLVKILVNYDPVPAHFKEQRHLNDSQYVLRHNGFFVYDLREVQTEPEFVLKLIFWRCAMEKVHFRFYFLSPPSA